MSLSKQPRSTTNYETRRQVKAWVYEALDLFNNVPISISQLRCHEPGCPLIETAIAVMSQPLQTFKIHAEVEALAHVDMQRAVTARSKVGDVSPWRGNKGGV